MLTATATGYDIALLAAIRICRRPRRCPHPPSTHTPTHAPAPNTTRFRARRPQEEPAVFGWRDKFTALCEKFKVAPAAACVMFSFLFDEIKSVALNTSSARRVEGNIKLADAKIPDAFWDAMMAEGLVKMLDDDDDSEDDDGFPDAGSDEDEGED